MRTFVVKKNKTKPSSWTSNKKKSFMGKYEEIASCTALLITEACFCPGSCDSTRPSIVGGNYVSRTSLPFVLKKWLMAGMSAAQVCICSQARRVCRRTRLSASECLQIDTAVTPPLLQDGFSRSSMIRSCSVRWFGRLEVVFLSRLLREMGSREVWALLAGSTEFP